MASISMMRTMPTDLQLTVPQAAAIGGGTGAFDPNQPLTIRRDDVTAAVFVQGTAPNDGVRTVFIVSVDGTAAKLVG